MSTSPEGFNGMKENGEAQNLNYEASAEHPDMNGLLNGIRDQLADAIRPLGLQPEDIDEAIEQVRAASRATTDYVRAKPLQSIGIAAGVGLLLGVLARRRY